MEKIAAELLLEQLTGRAVDVEQRMS